MEKYGEIIELYGFCVANHINCEFVPFLDGHAINFEIGDVVQHYGSYGSEAGKVEFGFTGYEDVDFIPTSLEDAKAFVLEHKDELSIPKNLKKEILNGKHKTN